MLKTKTARPAKAGTSNLVKAETAKEARGGDQYFSRAVGKALEVLEFLQAELKPLSMNEIAPADSTLKDIRIPDSAHT